MSTLFQNCSDEPIQRMGAIQDRGFLLGIHREQYQIECVSANIGRYLKTDPAMLLGNNLEMLLQLFPPVVYERILEEFKTATAGRSREEKLDLFVIGHYQMYLSVHLAADTVIYEFEEAVAPEIGDSYGAIVQATSSMIATRTVPDALLEAVAVIKGFGFFDRVFIYRFLEDGSGEVVAEAREDAMEALTGLRYPQDDIPRQARELYAKNHMRMLENARAADIPLLTLDTPSPDMTYCRLRALSPIHKQYCINMNISTSFSTSIMVEGKLWGLVNCHNTQPAKVDLKIRKSILLFTYIIASEIKSKYALQSKSISSIYREAVFKFREQLLQQSGFQQLYDLEQLPIYQVTAACGSAVYTSQGLRTSGITPPPEQIQDFAQWYLNNNYSGRFATNSISEVYSGMDSAFAGVLVLQPEKEKNELLIWFKPEQPFHIQWAGKPAKIKNTDSDGPLARYAELPRASFEIWREEVRNHSEGWSEEEIDAAMHLTALLLQVSRSRKKELVYYQSKITEASDNADLFTYAIAHDLKTPLTIIASYSQFLRMAKDLPEERKLKILDDITAAANKMSGSLNDLMSLTRLTDSGKKSDEVDFKVLVDEIIVEQRSAYGYKTRMEIADLPVYGGDRALLYQVFYNLIGNAMKYSSKAAQPEVKITTLNTADNALIFSISDNGIGIAAGTGNRVYDNFYRSDKAGSFKGTGLGLAIVSRIMHKIKGKIWYESVEGEGTSFFVQLP